MRYSADPDILEVTDPAELAWQAIEPIWDDLPISSFNKLAAFMEDLTPGQRGLIAVDWCQKEIRDGGHQQLFLNATGNLVPWALVGFQVIGATTYAAVLSEASSLLGPEYPRSASLRKKAYRELTADQRRTLEQLDDAFLNLLSSNGDDLEQHRGAYVKSHPREFARLGSDV